MGKSPTCSDPQLLIFKMEITINVCLVGLRSYLMSSECCDKYLGSCVPFVTSRLGETGQGGWRS